MMPGWVHPSSTLSLHFIVDAADTGRVLEESIMANELAVNSLGMLFIGFALATWLFGANVSDPVEFFFW